MNEDLKIKSTDCYEKCPVETAIDVLAGKWKILILWYLRSEQKRFSELQKLIPQLIKLFYCKGL